MKRAISLVLSFSFILTMLCACGLDSPSKTEITEQTLTTTQGENGVSQEHIDFILGRKVFMPDMDSLYRSSISDYDTVFDTTITFGDLINDTHFVKGLSKWEYLSNDDDMIMVSFSGMAQSISGEIPVVVGFSWTSKAKAPIVGHFILCTDSNGKNNEWSVDIIQNKYGHDTATAMMLCDALFSCMLCSALIDTSGNNQEQTKPSSPTTENTQPDTPSTPNNTPSTEKPTTPTMTAADYYKLGKDSHSSKQYLEAVEHFKKAGDYSDSSTMILDCYYQYGKSQMDLQYTSEGTKYLSMCRGYKDTDEILLSFYYSQATVAYNTLIQDFDTYGDHSSAYQDAKQKLLLCEGYKDSTTMMRVAESVYTACKEMDSVSGWEASLNGMTVSANGNNVSITKEAFMGGGGGDMVLSTNVAQKTFSATISHIFAPNMRNYSEIKVIEALLLLFTDINNTADLTAKLQSESNWTINETTETFSTSYGGYSVSIQVSEADWGYVDCKIKAEK